jgi:crossover junction endodeoxyribonuclease RuvC
MKRSKEPLRRSGQGGRENHACQGVGIYLHFISMIILGIDPGTATTGYGIIKTSSKKMKFVGCGAVRTKAGVDMPVRLLCLRDEIKGLIREFKPKALVVEKLFFNRNAKTAMTVSQAKGVVLLTAAEAKLPVFEYTALEAKKELVGYGRADKKEVKKAVKKCLGTRKKITPIDAADALAMAICHVRKESKCQSVKEMRTLTP